MIDVKILRENPDKLKAKIALKKFDCDIDAILAFDTVRRQAVSDCLSGCKRELSAYEEKLGHAKMFEEAEKRAASLKSAAEGWADEFVRLHPEYARDTDILKQIIAEDYSKS